MSETIAAIATPKGRGGIGIIKISGPDARAVLLSLFVPARRFQKPEFIRTGQIRHGFIQDPGEGRRVDEVLAFWMKAPFSYTGEDVAEIQTHGNSMLLHQILALVLDRGVRLARPGEFTLRAFLNGRMDLTQAEAVIDLINSENLLAGKYALEQLSGSFKNQLLSLLNSLETLKAAIEADIDFADELTDTDYVSPALSELNDRIIPLLKSLVKSAELYPVFTHGLKIGIAGAPNVGKSTLMNLLLGKDRVLVTPHPGTTRDYIEDRAFIKDLPVVICDTAGIRDSDDPVESLGIQRAVSQLDTVHLLLYVMDASGSREASSIDPGLFQRWSSKPLIFIYNKLDQAPDFSIPPHPALGDPPPVVCMSAKTGQNLDALLSAIESVLAPHVRHQDTASILPNPRQARLLQQALASLEQAALQMESHSENHLASLDITAAINHLSEILGRRYSNDILDRIFQRFCIGK